MTTCVVSFLCADNTKMLVTVMQSFKMLIISLWGTIYYLFGEDDYVLAVYGEVKGWCGYVMVKCLVGSFLLSLGVFVGINLFYGVMDLTGRPAFLYKYKIQGEHVCL